MYDLPCYVSVLAEPSPPSQFCYLCLNGGQLHVCDNCPRAICHVCLPPHTDLEIGDLTFLCLICHSETFQDDKECAYYVRAILI